jgi:hypothetical protein
MGRKVFARVWLTVTAKQITNLTKQSKEVGFHLLMSSASHGTKKLESKSIEKVDQYFRSSVYPRSELYIINVDLQFLPSSSIFNVDLQYMSSISTVKFDLQCRSSLYVVNFDRQYRSSMSIFNVNLQCRSSTSIFNVDLQFRCSMLSFNFYRRF